MIFARVSMILPLQNGHTAGRATSSVNRESGMMLFPFSSRRNPERMRGFTGQDAVGDPDLGVHDTYIDCLLTVRLFKSEHPAPVGFCDWKGW